jgi:predicted nuclease with TOPRIM domain
MNSVIDLTESPSELNKRIAAKLSELFNITQPAEFLSRMPQPPLTVKTLARTLFESYPPTAISSLVEDKVCIYRQKCKHAMFKQNRSNLTRCDEFCYEQHIEKVFNDFNELLSVINGRTTQLVWSAHSGRRVLLPDIAKLTMYIASVGPTDRDYNDHLRLDKKILALSDYFQDVDLQPTTINQTARWTVNKTPKRSLKQSGTNSTKSKSLLKKSTHTKIQRLTPKTDVTKSSTHKSSVSQSTFNNNNNQPDSNNITVNQTSESSIQSNATTLTQSNKNQSIVVSKKQGIAKDTIDVVEAIAKITQNSSHIKQQLTETRQQLTGVQAELTTTSSSFLNLEADVGTLSNNQQKLSDAYRVLDEDLKELSSKVEFNEHRHKKMLESKSTELDNRLSSTRAVLEIKVSNEMMKTQKYCDQRFNAVCDMMKQCSKDLESLCIKFKELQDQGNNAYSDLTSRIFFLKAKLESTVALKDVDHTNDAEDQPLEEDEFMVTPIQDPEESIANDFSAQEDRIQELERENQSLKTRMDALERLLSKPSLAVATTIVPVSNAIVVAKSNRVVTKTKKKRTSSEKIDKSDNRCQAELGEKFLKWLDTYEASTIAYSEFLRHVMEFLHENDVSCYNITNAKSWLDKMFPNMFITRIIDRKKVIVISKKLDPDNNNNSESDYSDTESDSEDDSESEDESRSRKRSSSGNIKRMTKPRKSKVVAKKKLKTIQQ